MMIESSFIIGDKPRMQSKIIYCIFIVLWTWNFAKAQNGTGGSTTLTTPSPEVASCASRCKEAYYPGKPCYCNEACSQFENCCFDFYAECLPDFVWSDDWVEHNGHEYKYFSDTAITASQSRQKCKESGALLVSINSEEEEQFIDEKVLRKRTLSAFIGGSDADKEGVWRWADNSRMVLPTDSWHMWLDGQPDDAQGQEHCSVMSNYRFWDVRKLILSSYVWLDFNCNINPQQVQGYVCERTLQCSDNPCMNGGTCQYVGVNNLELITNKEFSCQCLENYFGYNCEYEYLEGEIWTRCGETKLTDLDGVITSPLYPLLYPRDTKCQWQIQSDGNKTISLFLNDLDVEIGKDCSYDKLEVYDGDSGTAPLLLGPLCGDADYQSLTGTDIKKTLTSSGNVLTVNFKSDYSVNKRGFYLSYAQQKCGLGVGNSGCGTRKTFTSSCGKIEIKQGPENEICEWKIESQQGQSINLTFTYFNIEEIEMTCEEAHLSVYDVSEGGMSLLGRYCGQRFPWTLISQSNTIHLKLVGVNWQIEQHRISVEYETFETTSWRMENPIVEISGKKGTFSSTSSPVHISTPTINTYKWLVRVPYGDRLALSWTITASQETSILIYDGYSEESGTLIDLHFNDQNVGQTTHKGSSEAASFQALMVAKSQITDLYFRINVTFESKEWTPVLSGCYRPEYYDFPNSLGTENNEVRMLEPVIIMASNQSYAEQHPGYDAGLYCKWRIQGYENIKLSLTILNAQILPLTDNCNYDGLVINTFSQDSLIQTQHGPFCGSTFLKDEEIISDGAMTVIFYSDKRGGRRANGIIKGLIRTSDIGECKVLDMTESAIKTIPGSNCGIVLSPRFPGIVQPGLWTWIFEGKDNFYFDVYVYYVRGPGTGGDTCSEYFQILEISKDANALRQYETHLIKVCSSSDLFIPPRLKAPPNQKILVGLNTVTSSLSNIWQFKLSYQLKYMEPPPDIEPKKGETCPEPYQYYRGNCYRYYQWVLRHYLPEEYKFQDTWQSSLDQCRKEGGNLLSIHDEDEAYFIKWMLAIRWHWDPAATFQINHRLIYIGLNDKNGKYQWSDGSQLSYSDWYQPVESWDTPVVHSDTLIIDLLNLKNPQPNADVGSLCTVIMTVSPFKSLNWAKVPCDYPSLSGMICKMPAKIDTLEGPLPDGLPQSILDSTYLSGYQVCPEGWNLIGDHCVRLEVDYSYLLTPDNMTVQQLWSYGTAASQCFSLGGEIATLNASLFNKIKDYLQIWNFSPIMGAIWINTDQPIIDQECSVIEAYTKHKQDEDVLYRLSSRHCGGSFEKETLAVSVMCEMDITVRYQRCGANEFQCSNNVCVSVDNVCDDTNDCMDNSDELNCGCGEDMYQCENDRCIPISLYCDFIDQCGDNSDESGCVFETCLTNQFQCHNGECINGTKKCDLKEDCTDGSDEDSFVCEGVCKGFLCFSGACLEKKLQMDMVSDCPGLLQEDEEDGEREVLTFFDVYDDGVKHIETITEGCEEGGDYAQCRQGHPRCYRRSDTCIYNTQLVDESLDLSVQTSCRNGNHLRLNCGGVECPGMYHCPNSFCVGYHKVCDGVQDCPEGHDEMECDAYTCQGLFRCKGDTNCLPQEFICDGEIHCPIHKDDEKYCEKIDSLCESGLCNCTGYTIECRDANLRAFDLTGDNYTSKNIRALILPHNQLQISNMTFAGLHWLGRLNISHNGIQTLQIGVFKDLVNLFELDLSFNRISMIAIGTFEGLLSLDKLDLRNNELQLINHETWLGLTGIHQLIITNNFLEDVAQDAFVTIPTLKILNSDAYKFCCIAKQVEVCTPEADAFSSCEDLMANYPLQMSIWVLGFVAFFGNIFVVFWRLKTERGKVASFFIINLGISDFLMGIYMLIIASVDVHYRGTYIVHADNWRASSLCTIAGMLAMLSSEVSVFMLTAITMDRAITIMFPLKNWRLRMKGARLLSFIGWIICFILTILPASNNSYFGDSFFGRTGVCLPFQVTSDKQPGWEYSVFIFLVVNLISFLIIFIGYSALFMSVRSSMREMEKMSEKSTDNSAKELALAKKLMIIVVTDFMCWVPIILIGFAALGGATIPPQVSAWIAVFILPLNSAMNPILYTISALDCSGANRKPQASDISSGGTRTGMTSVTHTNPETNGTEKDSQLTKV